MPRINRQTPRRQELWGRFRAPLLGFAALGLVGLTGCMPSVKPEVGAGPAETEAKAVTNDEELRSLLDTTILGVLTDRRLSLEEHAAWQIVHGALAFKRAFPVMKGSEAVSAVDYLLAGGAMKGWLFEPGDYVDPQTRRRGLRAILEPGSKTGQGHADQWLGYLAECGLKPEETIRVGAETFTIADLIAQVEQDVPRNALREYSWTLMGLTTYRPTDYEWVASDGQKWSIARLVEIETGHDLSTSACGGTHRLYGLSMATNRYLASGGELTGVWHTADEKIRQAAARAKEYQNADGSFSTNYFDRPGASADLTQVLGSSGHIFEFLTLSLPTDEVSAPWMKRAAVRLCSILQQTKDIPLECGALYHATHGLVLYRDRLFGPLEFPYPRQTPET